jgi:sugar fermentation stimulation protein A
MDFETPLIPGTLIRRYKRFLADVELDDGREVTAHCANPGSMMGLNTPGLRVWLEPNDNPKRKLKFAWKLTELQDGAMTGIDTGVPNKVVGEALRAGQIVPLNAYKTVRPEQKYGQNSRIDFLLTKDGLPDAYVEVKNVHLMREQGLAEFPDSVTTRGAKHLDDLAAEAALGNRAVMLYLIQRDDCDRLDFARDIDPAYAAAFDRARSGGVEVLAYRCNLSIERITLEHPIPIVGSMEN